MRIDILTVFPEMFAGPMDTSILGRAKDKGILDIRLHNIRDYSESKHKNTDDYPFGGGAGMVMMAQPIFSCLEDVDPDHEALRIAMAPRGKTQRTGCWSSAAITRVLTSGQWSRWTWSCP